MTSRLVAGAKLCLNSDSMVSEKRNMTECQAKRISQGAQFGEISFDFRKMELCRADHPIGLTLLEFKVLKFLVSRPGIVVSRQKLIAAVWPKRKRSSYRTVDNFIVKLRQKIENNPDCPIFLLTIHGVGYKFVPHEKLQPFWQSAR
jgi:DNA-binding response OmpR family regulator